MILPDETASRSRDTLTCCLEAQNTWVPLAQWLALVTMTVEHACRYLLPADSPVTPWAITLGRIAFPLFAGMIAWHYCHNTRAPLRYAQRLLLIALVASLPYALVVSTDHLNVCVTLGVGLIGVMIVDHVTECWSRLALGIGLALAWLFIGSYVEYGHLGLLLVPAFVLAFRHPHRTLAAVPLLLVTAQVNATPLHLLVSTATAAALVAIANGSLRQTGTVPAMPRRLWLVWYPLHLSVIAVLTFWDEGAKPTL